MYRFTRQFVLVLICLSLVGCGVGGAPTPTSSAADPPTPSASPTAAVSAAPTATVAEPATPTAEPAATVAGPATPTAEPAATVAEPATGQGSIIFQAYADGSVRAIDLASGSEIILADPTDPNQRLAWAAAPDGRSIAVVVSHGMSQPKDLGIDYANDDAALWVVNVDGSEPRKLLDLLDVEIDTSDTILAASVQSVIAGPNQKLIWTPDGSEIIVTSAHEGQVDLYAVAADGSGVRRLTNTPDLELQATLDPTGQQLAYGSATSFGTGAGWGGVQAQVQPLTGGETQSIIGDPATYPPVGVSILGWTSSGQTVAATSDNGGGTTIVWIATPGQEPQKALELPMINTLEFAGDQLAYNSIELGQTSRQSTIYTWSVLASAEPTRIGTFGGFSNIWLSPDGQALLIAADGGSPSSDLSVWRSGTLIELGAASFEQVVWGDNNDVAVGGDEGGVINHSRTSIPLPAGAIPAGFGADNALYYFAPTAQGAWQLYLQPGIGAATAVGAPTAYQPFYPQLIKP